MPTPSSTLPPDVVLQPTSAGIARAAQLLTEGKLVILPTETVYGIGVNLLSADARAAATVLKGATPNWVLHLASPDEVFSWAPDLAPIARRLITKALPGPIAFQIKLSNDGLIGARRRLLTAADHLLPLSNTPDHEYFLTIRVPDATPTQSVIAATGLPIAIIGAGTPQQPGVFEIADLPEGLPVAAALDGGPTRYRRPSTVVRIAGDTFSVVRPGVIDDRIIQKLADFNVLFVCSGNTCRSPMAAALAMKMLADKLAIHPSELPLRHVVVQSAGVHAQRGMRATREAVAAAKSLGADLSSHQSQPATADLLRRADVIYTMTDAHRDELIHLMPSIAKKTHRLDAQDDVADPIGSELIVYQQVAEHLADLVKSRLSELRI